MGGLTACEDLLRWGYLLRWGIYLTHFTCNFSILGDLLRLFRWGDLLRPKKAKVKVLKSRVVPSSLMVSVNTIGRIIDFVRSRISNTVLLFWLLGTFFVIIPNFIFSPIIEIQIFESNSIDKLMWIHLILTWWSQRAYCYD